MPLHEYTCEKCGYEFEELVNSTEDSSLIPCKKCGSPAKCQMSRFASVIAGGGSAEPVDMTIGREAEKRWQIHFDRQNERRKDKTLETFNLPKTEDGKFMPVMALGDKSQKEKRKEYVGSLQEHRQDRIKKGQAQFTEAGAF